MKVGLLFDTSASFLRVGVSVDGEIKARFDEEVGRKQSELLLPTVSSLLESLSLSPKDVNYIVCGKGPGSYTGIRIALTMGKTFALALKIPLYLCSSLSLFRDGDKPTICLMDARAERSYIGVYKGNEVLLEDQAMTNEDVLAYIENHPHYALGGDLRYLDLASSCPVLDNLNRGNIKENEVDPLSAKPIYLKETYAVPNL